MTPQPSKVCRRGRRAASHRLAPFVLSAGLLASAVPSQVLLRDIAPPSGTDPGSDPHDFVDQQGVALFAATSAHGTELWRSDGTASGTWMVEDLRPGARSSAPRDFNVAADGRAYFLALVRDDRLELWCTDGTADGTLLLLDPTADAFTRSSSEPTPLGSTCLFTRTDADHGRELWITDGTVPGTRLLVDLRPGFLGSEPRDLVAGTNHVWFHADIGSWRQLWRTDGTAAGTVQLTDVQIGIDPERMTAVPDGRLFFSGNDRGTHDGRELYVSDGTRAGTRLVVDLGGPSRRSTPRNLLPLRNGVYFEADDGTHGREPWFSDGTAAGTVSLGDLLPGSSSSTRDLAASDGTTVVFVADDGVSGAELWRTDGTLAGTARIADLEPGPGSSEPADLVAGAGGFLWTAQTAATGRELWFTDGTPGSLRLVADLATGPSSGQPADLGAVGSRVFFSTPDAGGGREPWSTDATSAGTGPVADLHGPGGSSTPGDLLAAGSRAVFHALDPALGREPFVSDGTPAGTVPLDVRPGTQGSDPRLAVSSGERVWFVGDVPGAGAEVLSSDGTPNGTGLFADVLAGPVGSNPTQMYLIDGDLYLQAEPLPYVGYEPTRVDGDDGTVTVLGNLATLNLSSYPSWFASTAGGVVFAASGAPGSGGLWVTDGTPDSARFLVDPNGPGTSGPERLTSFGDLAAFRVFGGGYIAWVTDGTAAGTRAIPNVTGRGPRGFTGSGDRLYFIASESGFGEELFTTDATATHTERISDINPGIASPDLRELVAVPGDRVMFAADGGATGVELYVSDGTVAGTRMVVDLLPGPGSGVLLESVAALGDTGFVAFAGSDGHDGMQLWISDGTAEGTQQLGRIGTRRGQGAVRIAEPTLAGDRVFFFADDGATGLEPWSFDLAAAATPWARRFGTACAGDSAHEPRIGARGLPRLGAVDFAVTVQGGPAGSLALLSAAAGSGPVRLDSCTLHLAPPLLDAGTAVLDADGSGDLVIPVPVDAALAGARVFAQWLVVDPDGPLLDAATLSDGLRIQVGR